MQKVEIIMSNNIIIIHLESLNSMTFLLHPDWFPNIFSLKGKAQYYSNYYSTATSTYMVTTDLLFGDTNLFEKSAYLEDIFSIAPSKKSLLQFLGDKGYKSKIYTYFFPENEDTNRYMNVFGKDVEKWTGDCLTNMIDDLKLTMKNEHFAIFIQSDESHLESLPAYGQVKGVEACKYRFEKLDQTVGEIIKTVKKAGRFENTLLVLYGDHGDDFWGHGIHDGYTHAIEPYNNVINCPLIIYNPSEKNCEISSVVSTEDIADLVLYKLGFKKKFEFKRHAYSRNLFVNQNLCVDSFNKSYSVTDGKFLLMVSNRGLSLFNNDIDFYNAKNMLDFFEYKNGNLKYVAANDLLNGSHFHYFMTTETKKEISDVFYRLRYKLIKHVTQKYGNKEVDVNFNAINYSYVERLTLPEWMFRFLKTKIKDIIHLIGNN